MGFGYYSFLEVYGFSELISGFGTYRSNPSRIWFKDRFSSRLHPILAQGPMTGVLGQGPSTGGRRERRSNTVGLAGPALWFGDRIASRWFFGGGLLAGPALWDSWYYWLLLVAVADLLTYFCACEDFEGL
ncbi:hypothetical protein RHGRI_001641 [Rhododendron griersonianum]|uniref:Uncharacterized protein n=1 Tax=Rhododendron griersonianum TaxID=479676 RepID=A0AAV6LN43_9ERIC|nr:hypothetical protein RHGRI_001641 [Rhododendron griersonianum]